MPGLETLGRYEIVAELGHGAMGTVYEAVDSSLDRLVALKTVRLDPTGPDYAEFRERFRSEAKSAGRLSHPNIVTIHDFGEVGETAYIAMEFLRGETLRAMLDRQRFSVRRAVRYALQIADGLAAAHAAGVVHRDIKPANVLRLRSGLLKITDFGIAQLPASQLTQDGTFLGTPKYMSPEQGLGLRVDGRSDIFSLGVVLYEMLTGTLPFGGSTLNGLMSQIVYEQPIHPKRWNPAAPDALVHIVAKCLAKNPDMRYGSAAELGRDLRLYKYMDSAVDTSMVNVFLPIDPEHAQDVPGSNASLPTPDTAKASEAPSNDHWHKTLSLKGLEGPAPTQTGAPNRFPRATPSRGAIGFTLGAFMAMAAGLYAFDRAQAPAPPLLDHAASRGPVPLSQSNATAPKTVMPPLPQPASASSAAPEAAPPAAAVNAATAAPLATSAAGNPPPATSRKTRPVGPLRKGKKGIVARPLPVTPVILPETHIASVPVDQSLDQRSLQPAPFSPERQKAARLAAFRRDLENQHDCLVSNKCN